MSRCQRITPQVMACVLSANHPGECLIVPVDSPSAQHAAGDGSDDGPLLFDPNGWPWLVEANAGPSFESGVLARLDKLIELQTEGPATPKVPDVADAQFIHGMRCSARLMSLQRTVQMQNAMLSHPGRGGTKPEEVIFMLKELHRLISEDLS